MCHIHPIYVFFYWDNYVWRYCTSKNLMMQKVLTRMQFGCLSSHWQFLGIQSVFWLKRVVWECQISIATYLRGYLPSYQVVLQCIWNWHATLKSLRTDTHADRQPQYNSFITDSRLNYKVASEFVLHRKKMPTMTKNLAHNRLEKIFWPWKWEKKILWLVWWWVNNCDQYKCIRYATKMQMQILFLCTINLSQTKIVHIDLHVYERTKIPH